jgi:hypothetical protein
MRPGAIPFTEWSFYDYYEGDVNCLTTWFQSLDPSVRDDVADKLRAMLLAMRPRRIWPEKWFSAYKGRDNIYEIRITFKKVQYRPFGCYRPGGNWGFTLIGGSIEKGDEIPASALTVLEARMNAITWRTVREHTFD